MWYAIWILLALAALAAPALLTWRLWGKVRGIGDEVAAAGERIGAAFDGAGETPAPAVPTLFAAGTRGRVRALRASNRVRRDRRRAANLRRVEERWVRHGLWPAGHHPG